tara:strand:+ start:290 stop:787 length:498 start_codon:yes stop_codon:yes gene_type:complete
MNARVIIRNCVFCLLILTSHAALAVAPKVPYYASIRVQEANVRTGPSIKYPIEWVYKRKTWPVKIVATFEDWRKIVDMHGEVGWIHNRLLSKQRHAVINSNGVQEVHRSPLDNSAVSFIAENGVIGQLVKCQESWCQVQVDEHKGWVKRKFLWGADQEDQNPGLY